MLTMFVHILCFVLMLATSFKRTESIGVKKGTGKHRVQYVIFLVTKSKKYNWTTADEELDNAWNKVRGNPVFQLDNGYRGFEINKKLNGISQDWTKIQKCTNPTLELNILRTAPMSVISSNIKAELEKQITSCPK